jgi:hypothetical protein
VARDRYFLVVAAYVGVVFGCDAIVGVHDLPVSGSDAATEASSPDAEPQIDSGLDSAAAHDVETKALADAREARAEVVDATDDQSADVGVEEEEESASDASISDTGVVDTGGGDAGVGDAGVVDSAGNDGNAADDAENG